MHKYAICFYQNRSGNYPLNLLQLRTTEFNVNKLNSFDAKCLFIVGKVLKLCCKLDAFSHFIFMTVLFYSLFCALFAILNNFIFAGNVVPFCGIL